MKNELIIVAAVGVAAALAGCTSTTVVDPESYTEVDGAMATMAANYIDGNGVLLDGVNSSATPLTNVPAVGSGAASATYNGFVGGDVTGGAGALAGRNLVGELELTADFNGGTISGTADNFYDDTNAQYTGTLNLAGPITGIADPMMTPNLAGNLSNGGIDYATDIAFDGFFVGDAYEAVAGQAFGTVDGGAFDGAFVAER